ncbi:hypothetical protein CDAR_118701 [Caerostris darwini]|uniref:Secreted protein n=1 Tax=Caerostris darwini TaxID=1538125 RepID=A0AAV4VJJ8_9ARAC|nr:hypothetical protein CDAR_118701 [Caerostris darwini]
MSPASCCICTFGPPPKDAPPLPGGVMWFLWPVLRVAVIKAAAGFAPTRNGLIYSCCEAPLSIGGESIEGSSSITGTNVLEGERGIEGEGRLVYFLAKRFLESLLVVFVVF